MNIAPHAQTALNILQTAGYEAFVVGGCVRDSLMGGTPLDWDVCTNATPEQTLAAFSRFFCIKTGLQHGTVTVMIDKKPIEVTTYRLDGNYSDARHPDSVTFVSELREDLARRDFTINAMAYNAEVGLVDYFGGQDDLTHKTIRCVGEAQERFAEDALRILRALRFASRLGFDIEYHTAEAMRALHHLLANISVERIYKELKGILVGQWAGSLLICYPEIFTGFMPELAPMVGHEQHHPAHIYDIWEHSAHSVQAAPATETLRLAALLHDCGKPCTYQLGEDGLGHCIGHPEIGAEIAVDLLKKLKSDTATIKAVEKLVLHHGDSYPTTRAGMRRWIGKWGEEGLQHLFQLKRADILAQSSLKRAEKLAALAAARNLRDEVLSLEPSFTLKDLKLGGEDLIAMGVKPSPEMRQILEKLLHAVQEEQLDNEPEALRAMAMKMINS